MSRIAVVSASSPLWAGGVAAALAPVAAWHDWDVRVQPGFDDADAAVLQFDDRGSPHGARAAPPPRLPAVVLGAAPPGWLQTQAARPLALLPAHAPAAPLRAAVAAVLAGLSVHDPQAAAPAWAGADEPLTPREIEVFELLAKGLSNRDIGAVLAISSHTAKYHVGQILAKLGAATRAEAVSAGLRLGLVGL